jgi:hypothetical protein
MALIDVCAAFVPPGHALAVRLRATHCPRAIALPQRGVLDGHAVLSLAFPPLSVGGATQGKSNGRQTRRSRSSVRRSAAWRAEKASRMVLQGLFTASAKRLRAEHRRPARRTAISRTVSSSATEAPFLEIEQPDPARAVGAREVADHAERSLVRAAGRARRQVHGRRLRAGLERPDGAARGSSAEGALRHAPPPSAPCVRSLWRADASPAGGLRAVRDPVGRSRLPPGIGSQPTAACVHGVLRRPRLAGARGVARRRPNAASRARLGPGRRV